MITKSYSYAHSIGGLLISKNTDNKMIEKDIDEFIGVAPTLAEKIRSSIDEKGGSFWFIQNMYAALALLKSVNARWLQTEAELIIRSAEANRMNLCRKKIEPFISSLLSISIEMQMAQKRAVEQSEIKRGEVELYTDIVNNLTAVINLIAVKEYDRANEMISSMDDLKNDALAAGLAESLRKGCYETAGEQAKQLRDDYMDKIERHGYSESDSQMEILAVDDRPDILRTVAGILRGYYKVSTVTSGDSALKFLQVKRPDLFILDIEMPGMDGFELARKIRDMEGLSKTPILFLTSNSSRDYVLRAVQSGGNDFIVKPANRNMLLSRVGKYLFP